MGSTIATVRADRAVLRDYFVTALKVLPDLKVSFGDQLIRVYGDTAVNQLYLFIHLGWGEQEPAGALQLHHVKNGDRWLIVDHHFSAMPPPPK